MKLAVLLDIVTVPVPVRAVEPAMNNCVLLFELLRLMLPLFVIVPAPKLRMLLLGIFTLVPVEIVKLVSVGPPWLLAFTLSITPPEDVVSVPPVILTLFSSTVEPAPEA